MRGKTSLMLLVLNNKSKATMRKMIQNIKRWIKIKVQATSVKSKLILNKI